MAQKIIVSKRLPTKRIQNHSKLCAMHANITLTNSKSLAVSRVAGFIQNTSLLLRVKLFSFVCLFVCFSSKASEKMSSVTTLTATRNVPFRPQRKLLDFKIF